LEFFKNIWEIIYAIVYVDNWKCFGFWEKYVRIENISSGNVWYCGQELIWAHYNERVFVGDG